MIEWWVDESCQYSIGTLDRTAKPSQIRVGLGYPNFPTGILKLLLLLIKYNYEHTYVIRK